MRRRLCFGGRISRVLPSKMEVIVLVRFSFTSSFIPWVGSAPLILSISYLWPSNEISMPSHRNEVCQSIYCPSRQSRYTVDYSSAKFNTTAQLRTVRVTFGEGTDSWVDATTCTPQKASFIPVSIAGTFTQPYYTLHVMVW